MESGPELGYAGQGCGKQGADGCILPGEPALCLPKPRQVPGIPHCLGRRCPLPHPSKAGLPMQHANHSTELDLGWDL